jgi:DNA-binding SARP family transcriptional activator/predicted ATPase
MAHLTLGCFGAFQATLDDQPLTHFHSVKVQALLAYLALEAERPHHRETLATLLWPLDNETSARNSLRQALYELRKRLSDSDNSSTPFLLVTRQTVQFDLSSDHTLDVADFLTYIKHGALEEAVSLYRGELLAGLACDSEPFEEWLRLTRTHFHNLAVDACFKVADQALARADAAQAQTYARRQLALEPWREEAHRQLMTALALSGERSAALAQYETCRRVLADELGVEPDEETTALYEQIKAGKLRAARSDPLPVSLSLGEEPILHGAPPQTVRHNLPPQPTPFVGRTAELAQVTARLADPACRLFTIVGPGGMGKTRLALQAAQTILDFGFGILDLGPATDDPQSKIQNPKFEDGVFFVALASVDSPALLVSTLAAALNFTFYGSGAPKSQLLDYLQPKSLLLVFDNFEHLLDGVDFLPELLGAAPGVKILVTSRQSLNLREEWLHPLTGMDLPAETVDAGEFGVQQLAESGAVQLFAQCAQRMRPSFDLAAEVDAVVRICRLAQGMPLAIELAASWFKFFSCEQIAQEVARNLDFLSTTLRNIPARHRSMRAVFEHSWGLLSPAEQEILRRMALFRGEFQPAAALQVAGAAVADLVELVEKSLLQPTPGGRFQMHELLRQFAEEKLHSDPVSYTQTSQLHTFYYTSLLERQAEHLKSAKQLVAINELEAEIDNIRAAWERAVEWDDLTAIARAAEALYLFHDAKCWYVESSALFQRAAQSLATGEPTPERQWLLAHVLIRQAQAQNRLINEGGRADLLAETQAIFERSLALLLDTDEPGLYAEIMLGLAPMSARRGDFPRAHECYQVGLLAFERSGDRWGVARSLHNLGYVASRMGQFTEAIGYFERGLALAQQLGDPRLVGDLSNRCGEAQRAVGNYAEAARLARAGLAARTAVQNKRGIAYSLYLLGDLAWRMGQFDEALAYSTQSRDLFSEIGLVWGMDFALNNLGNIACTLGDFAEARRCFWAILQPELERGDLGSDRVPEALVGLATVLRKEEKHIAAVELLERALNHPAAWQETKDRAGKLLAELAAELPPEVMAVARAQTQPLHATVAAIFSPPFANQPSARSDLTNPGASLCLYFAHGDGFGCF